MTATTLLWLAAALFTFAVAALALSQSFSIEELSIFGVGAKLTKPIAWKGRKWLKPVAVTLFIGAAVYAILGTKVTLTPSAAWPERFKDVRTAEIQLTEPDDEIDVKVNGIHLAHTEFGQAAPWMSIREVLKPGPNVFEIWITNAEYGGCGGTVTLRLNGLTHPDYRWSMRDDKTHGKGDTCFRFTPPLYLSP